MLPTQSFTFTAEGNTTRIDLSVVMKTSGFFSLMEFMLPAKLKKIWERYFENLDQIPNKQMSEFTNSDPQQIRGSIIASTRDHVKKESAV